MEIKEDLRIDKWLWATRIFKTRSLATQACKAGKVKIDGLPVKPSRTVAVDMVITVQNGPITKTIKVISLLQNRVGAKLVSNYLQDLTPPEELEKLKLQRELFKPRPRGAGRPTKKERRDMDTWVGWD
jgi:ribosome-associated heat shock protein Hsp15